MRRYVVIGAGAIGAGLCAQFELHHIPYVLVGRGAQIRHILAEGLSYVRPGSTQSLRLQACEGAEGVALQAEDVLVIATKAQDVEAVCRAWAWRPVAGCASGVAAALPVMTLQNGLAAERVALRWFRQVYGASINTPARFTRIGQIVVGGHPEPGLVVVGRFPRGEDALARFIAADLCRAGYLAESQPDITRWKAAKLLNNMRNALELFDGAAPRLREFHARLVDEARAVFAAMGIEPARADERRQSVGHWGIAPDSGIEPGQQSTWQSFARGVPSEVDYLNGEIALLGRLHGVPTPCNDAVQVVLGELEAKGEALAAGPADVESLWAALAVAS